jgi:hypothetical protein
MTSYAVAPNFNNTAGLVVLDPQPAQPNILTWPNAVYGGDGLQGLTGYPTVELVWGNLLERAEFDILLNQCGLDLKYGSVIAGKRVTLRCLDNDEAWVSFNAVVQAPRSIKRTYIGFDALTLAFVIHGVAS